MQAESLRNLLRKVRRNPTNLLTASFRFNSALIHVVSDIRENFLRGKLLRCLFYFFGHISPFTWLQPLIEGEGATGAVPHEPSSIQYAVRSSSELFEHCAPFVFYGHKNSLIEFIGNKQAYRANRN